MDRIKGVTLKIFNEDYSDILREYQDPEGWRITDAGLNEDEDGYYMSVEARGVGGVRQIALSLTASALRGMLNALDLDSGPVTYYSTLNTNVSAGNAGAVNNFKIWNTAGTNAAGTKVEQGCCDGCLCQQSV